MPFAPVSPLIRIDLDPRQIGIGPRPRLALVGDSALSRAGPPCDRLASAKLAGDPKWAATCIDKSRKLMQRTREPEDPFYDLMFARIRDELGDPIIIGNSTKPVYRAMLNYHAPGPRAFFSAATGFGTLGWALPAASGLSCATDRPVVTCLATVTRNLARN